MRSFYIKLADRLYNENDLSDITWALCSSNDAFQKAFLDYCFDNSIKNDIDYIEREFAKDNTRPDFLIIDDKENQYLLEVKKQDKNIHKNYKKTYKDIPRAFIAEYKLLGNDDVYHYKKTWYEFIEHIEKQKESINGLNNTIVKGYLDYLKAVTNYFKGETMNISNLHSLHILLKTIEQIIVNYNSEIKPKFVGSEYWSGYKFKFKQNKKEFHVWFGVVFDDNKENYIVMEFLDECSNNIKKELLGTNKGKYFKKPYPDDSQIYVDLDNKYVKILCDTEKSFEEQKEVLEKYFIEVMNIFQDKK